MAKSPLLIPQIAEKEGIPSGFSKKEEKIGYKPPGRAVPIRWGKLFSSGGKARISKAVQYLLQLHLFDAVGCLAR